MRVSEFINKFEHKEFLNGTYRTKNWEEILPGVNSKEFAKLSQAANAHGQNIAGLLQELEKSAPAGLIVDVNYDKHGNINVSYLLDDQAQLSAEEIRKDLSIPQFHLSIDDHGVGLRNGLKTINQNVLDTWEGELILYTKAEKLLREEIRKFQAQGTNFKKNIEKGIAGDKGAMRSAANSVKYTAKLVQQKLASAGDYKALNEDSWKARQGTGSKQSLLARRGYTDVRPIIQNILKENRTLINKYRKQNQAHKMSYDRVESEIEKDIMQLLTIYGQNMKLDKIEQEIKSTDKFKYLFDKGNVEKAIKSYGKQINKLHPYIGTSQESSVDNFLMSFVKNSDLGFMGALDDRSSRKRVQVSNTYSVNGIRESAKKAKIALTKEGVVFTKAQSQNDISKEDLETRMYGLIYATQEEINNAQAAAEAHIAQKLLDKASEESKRALRKVKKGEEGAVAAAMAGKGIGSHSGGIFYSKEVEKSLDAVQERFKTISKDDVLNRMNTLRKSGKKGITGLSDDKLRERAIRELLADSSKMDRKEFFKILKGYSVDYEDDNSYNIKYKQARHMHSGTKLLTTSDYDRVNAQAIDPEVFIRLIMGRAASYGYTGDESGKRDWAKNFIQTNKISMLKTQDKVNARNFSGYLENYLNGVFDYFRSVGNTNPFGSKSKKFQDWMSFKDGQFVVNQDIFSGTKADKKVLGELISVINDVLPEGNMLKNIFTFSNGKNVNGGIDIDFSRLIGYTGANQFNTYDYGAPGKTVTADYRYKGATERGMAGASLVSGKNFGVLAQLKKNYLKGDAKDQQNLQKYQQKQKEVADAIRLSRATQSKDFAFKDNDIILSYAGIDGRDALVLNDQGELVYKKDNKKYTGGAAYIDLSQDYQRLSAEDYDRKTGRVKASGLKGTIYDAIAQAAAVNKGGQLYYRPGTQGGAYYVSDGKHDIRGTAVALPNYNAEDWKVEDGLVDLPNIFNEALSSVLHAEDNYQRVLGEQIEGRENKDQVAQAKEELMMSVAAMFGAVNDEVNNKNGSIFKLQKIKLGHSMMGTAEASNLSNLGGDFEKNLLDVSALVNNETLRELLKPQHLKLDGQEVGETQAEYNKVLKTYLQYMYGDNFEKVAEEYSKEYKSSDSSRKTNKILEQLVIDSVTLGSEQFNKRKAESQKNGTVLRGLGGEFARFPLSNGLDIKDVEIFAGDKQLIDQDKIRVGLGLGQAVNADFDGDKLVLHLDMAEAKSLAGLDTGALVSQKQDAVDLQKKLSAAVGAVTLASLMEDMSLTDGKSSLGKKDLDIIFNEEAQSSGAIASRLNKHYTGFLSNNYQGIVETMQKLDANTLDPNNPANKEKFIEQMIVRGIFEGFTQDAISSKKVTQRIAKKHGSGFADSLGFLTELQGLMDVFSNENTYTDRSKFNQAFAQAESLGLMEQDKTFSGRIAAQIIAYAQQMYTDKNGNIDKAGLAKALHVQEKDLDGILFNYDYDKNGQVSGVSIGDNAPNLSMDIVKDITWQYAQSHPGGLGWAQRNKGNRPGGISTANNPIYYLGENHITTAEYDSLDDNLKQLVETYDALSGQAITAADAINAEAEAEKNKIGVATEESKAINKLSSEYSGLVNNVGDLNKLLESGKTPYSKSVSNYLDSVFGAPFAGLDTSGFESNLASYIKEHKGSDFSKVKAEDLGITEDNFKKFGAALIPTMRGKIADSIEQVLGEAAKLGIKGLNNLNGSDDFNEVLAALSGEGTGAIVNGREISWSPSKAKKFINSKSVQDLREYIDTYISMIRIIKGENSEDFIKQTFGAGNAMWKTTLALAGGDLKNVGASEGFSKAYLSDRTALHGRFDREVFGTGKVKIKDGENDEVLQDINTLTILDKKFAQKVSPRYIAQVYSYIKSREQARDYALDNGLTNYDDFFASDLGKQFLDSEGNKGISEKEFYQLIGYHKTKDGWKPIDSRAKGAQIHGGITLTGNDGMSRYYDLGYTDTSRETGRSEWRFVKDKQLDQEIKAYFASGGSYEDMPEFLKTVMGQAAHEKTSKDLNFKYHEFPEDPNKAQQEAQSAAEQRQKEQNQDQKHLEKLLKEYESSYTQQQDYDLARFKAGEEGDQKLQAAYEHLWNLRKQYAEKLKDEYQKAVDEYKSKYGEENNNEYLLTPEELAAREADTREIHFTKKHDEYIEKRDSGIIAEAKKEYSDARKQRTELLKQSDMLGARLADKSGVYSEEEKEEFQELKKAIDDQIVNVLDDKIKHIKEAFSAGGEHEDLAERFSKEVLSEVDKKQDLKEKINKSNLAKEAAAEIRRRQAGDKSEVYGAYNAYNNAQYKTWEVDQRIAREKDEKKKEFLQAEKESLVELEAIAKDRVDSIEGRRKDSYWKGILKSESHRANLRFDARKNDYLARQKDTEAMASAYRGGSKTDILGIDSATIRWVDRLMSGGVLMKFLALAKRGISSLIQQAKALDKAMTNLRIVTNDSAANTKILMNSYAKLGKELGATTLEVANSATEWLRQGYESVEVNKLITASMYLSKLGMIDSATATKDLTSAMKGFKMEASEAMNIVDKLTAIDLKAATSAGEIAEGLSQFANLATLSGVNIDQAAAYVATIADVTQNSGSQVGASMKTIISRYGNVKAGAYNKLNTDDETSETSENLNDVERVLHKLNIDIRDSNLNFKDFDVVLDEIADKWGTLDNVSKKAIANAFAGVRQQEAFVTLMENYDKYESLLETSENSAGTAETKYQSYKDSYEAAKNALTSTIQEFVNNSNLNVILIELTKGVTKTIELFGHLIKYLPGLIAQAESIKAFFGKSMMQTAAYRMKDYFTNANNNPLNGRNKTSFLNSAQWKNSPFAKLLDTAKAKKMAKLAEEEAKAKEQVAQNAQQEVKQKKYTYKYASLETLKKDGILTDAKLEKAVKEGVITEGQKEFMKKQDVVSKGRLEELAKAGIITEAEKEKALKEQVAQNAEKEAAVEGSSTTVSSSSDSSKVKAGGKWAAGTTGAQKFSAVMAGASVLSSGIMAGFSNFQTGAATHKYNGEEVESSESARKAGRGWAMAGGFMSVIPVLGPILNTGFMHIGEKIAGKIDEERDRANADTAKASEIIAGLTGIEGNIASLGETKFGTIESQKSVDEFLKTIYSEDNEETRKVLDQYLGAKGTNIYSVLTKIKDNTADSAEAYRQLQLAELQAKKDQVSKKYATSLFNSSTKVNEAYAQYDGISGYNATSVGKGIGTGVAVGAAGTLMGVAAGFAAAGTANGWNPAGWIMLGIGAAAGIIGGIVAGVETAQAEAEQERQKAARESAWAQLSTTEKIAQVQADMAAGMRDGNSEVVEKCQSLLSALNEQNALTNQIINEINEITAQQGLISAYVSDNNGNKSYISDMTTAQLKELGLDKILLAYAQGLEENGGLIGRNVWSDSSKTRLSDTGYSYLQTLLRNQEDDEINSVLGGQAYTLKEALKLRDKYPNQKWVKDILESFSAALNVPFELLEQLQDQFGELTLNELLMSTSDISDTIGKYNDLINSVTSGTGDVSSWMSTIIDQFPDLIAYMSDVPTLFSKIGTKLQQLSKAYIQSQYEDTISSEGFFSTIQEEFYNALSQGAADTLKGLGGTGATSISSVLTWLKTQYGADGSLTEVGTEVLTKLKDVVNEYGVEITSSVLKEYYDQIINFQTSNLDKQISNLNEQKEALQEINSQREYENKLIEAKLKLENASKEKKRVYRAGVGWVYESDQAAIKEAQENLATVENEKTVSALEQQIAELESQKTELEKIYDEQNYETLSKLYEAFVDQAEKDGTNASTSQGFLQAILSGINGISTDLSELLQSDSDSAANDKVSALEKAKQAWNTLQTAAASGSSQEYNTALEAYRSAASAAQSAGATKDDMSGWGTAKTGSNGSKEQSAWEAAQDSKDNQSKDSLLRFTLDDLGYPNERYWTGTVNLANPEYSSKVLDDYIFGDIKKGRASVYTKNGGYQITKDDYRFKPNDNDTSFLTYANRMKSEQGLTEAVYIGWDGGKEAVYFYNGQVYTIRGDKDGADGKIDQVKGSFPGQKFAEEAQFGSLGLSGGTSLINEVGTEAIITPQGTITALPSRTGIVPADVTKNLWALGEVAPSIMRTIQAHIAPDTIGTSSLITSNDDSFNIDSLTMNVSADNSFDADAFVDSIKARIALTRNLKHN